MRETDADRPRQAGHGERWTSRRDERGGSNARHSCLVTALHSLSGGLGGAVFAHSSERAISDSEGDASKVETQKREQSVHAYFRKNQKRSILRTRKYDDLITAEHKVLNKGRESRNNHLCAVVYKFSPLSGIRVKPKLHKRRRRICESFKGRRRSQKLSILTIYKNLATTVKNYHGIIEQLHFVDQRQAELQNELYVELKKRQQPYYCNLDRMRSGSRVLWNAVAICEMSKNSWQTGFLRMNEDLENHLKNQLFHLVHWWNISQTPRETKREFIKSERKYYQESLQDMLCSRVEFEEKMFWLLRIKNWTS